MNYYDIMNKAFQQEGLLLGEDKYNKFITYMNLLKEWNEKVNLTAIVEEEQIIKKHFIDSIKCFRFKPLLKCESLIDVGTGGGFPGLPIKITDENIKITLLDSLNKRINFLEEVIKKLELTNINAIHSRAEDLARNINNREQYDAAVSRAVANLAVLSELCLPFVKVGGYFVAMKGPSIESELNDAKNAIGTLGGKIEEIMPVDIEDTDLQHNLVIIKKIKKTPEQYPRKAGVINKKPIK